MEKRTLGKTGMQVSILGFGAAEIGFQGVDAPTVTRLLAEALDAGLNIIDTAECYANSEELIGQTVGHRRSDYFLFTKCGHTGKTFDPPMADWDPAMLELSIDRSLQRLKTDRVDLLQLHSCGEETLRAGDVIRVAERAKAAGKTRFIGYSGDGAAARFAVTSGLFDTLQTSVNVADQEALDLTLVEALERNVGVIAKRPVANAVWRVPEGGGDQLHYKNAWGYYRAYWERLKKLDYQFLQQPLPQAVGTALKFTLSCPGVATAIVGTTKPGRWKENAAMLHPGILSSEEFNEIRVRWENIADATWVGQV